MEDDRTFTEVFTVVKYKIEHNLPMTTVKEELMEDFIKDWAETFGYDSTK